MIFYSHSKPGPDGTKEGSKLLKVHIDGVLKKALFRLNDEVDLGLPKEDVKELLTLIVSLHDLGKYTSFFQNYLLQKEPIDQLLKHHSRIGALAAYNTLKEKNEKLAITALYLIFLHHSSLLNIDDIPAKLDRNLQHVFQRQRTNLENHISFIQEETGLKELEKLLEFPDERKIRRAIKIWAKKESNIHDYFIFNYLFSLLIEADKLDASDTGLYNPVALSSSAVDERFNKPQLKSDNKNLDQLSNNELRNFCRAEVVRHLHHPEILDHYLFTLTAPTGIGKTMTALDFALKLKEKIRNRNNFEAPIIYALPFINIIEQALKEYKDTLPGTAKVLGHYQFADVFGKSNDNDARNYNQKLMSLDTWQGDVVITSFVQFFETLIGNRNKLLKKFNHFAGAIIILDEVQTLRLDQMPLIGATLYYLAKFLKSRVILMTATKPKVFELAQKEILDKEGDLAKPFELLSSYQEVFQTFRRTKIIPLLNQEFDKDNVDMDFIEAIFAKKWSPGKSCLIVCNTVKRSIELHKAVSSFLEEREAQNPVFYLSTNIIPAHRFERIQQIKDALNDELAPILISTQVVEAGVDLDFDMGFRDIGPIDSIIQVAGRINRNNNLTKVDSPLYIIDFGDAHRIYGRITYEQAKKALKEKDEFFEKEYLDLITTYFDSISEKSSFAKYREIFKSMKSLKYDAENKNEHPVSSFKIIDDSQTSRAVFIEFGEYEAFLRDKYLQKIKGEITTEEFD
jgi:CRISPR-associated endonuclease/helicase Cas3